MKFGLFLIALFSFVNTISAQTAAAEKAVNARIRKETVSQDGKEFKKARKIILSDVDGDGDRDAVVQYTLEGMGGGNSFAQMLAVFLNNKGVFKFQAEEVVGGKFFSYTSVLTGVKAGKILLATETCEQPPQGLCKKPKKGKVTFKLVKGILTEL